MSAMEKFRPVILQKKNETMLELNLSLNLDEVIMTINYIISLYYVIKRRK